MGFVRRIILDAVVGVERVLRVGFLQVVKLIVVELFLMLIGAQRIVRGCLALFAGCVFVDRICL